MRMGTLALWSAVVSLLTQQGRLNSAIARKHNSKMAKVECQKNNQIKEMIEKSWSCLVTKWYWQI